MANTLTSIDVVAPPDASRPGTSWGAIVAGGAGATATTLVLVLVGSGLGLTAVSPFSGEGISLASLGVWTAIWLVIVQWLSAGLGGYLAGRLRTRWVSIDDDEVVFRDTAHGFLAWTLATLLLAGLMGSVISAVAGAGVQAAATTAGAAAQTATEAVAEDVGRSYFVDTLLRPAAPAATPQPGPDNTGAEIGRLLAASAVNGEMLPDDRAYLEQVVAARTGLTPAEAKMRVDAVLERVDQAALAAKQAAEKARVAGATFALVGALSLVIGAFIASAAAAWGGRLRDDDDGSLSTIPRSAR